MVDKEIKDLILLNSLVLKAKMILIKEGHSVAFVTEIAIVSAWHKQEIVKIIISQLLIARY